MRFALKTRLSHLGGAPYSRSCSELNGEIMQASSQIYDAIVLGAGAAGMMCAAVAGSRGRRVLLVDHAAKAGKKILISGGGRCNFTNFHCAPDRFLSDNPHFAKSALGRYQPRDFIALIDHYGIAWHEKTLGQLFCDGSARQVVDMLLSECAKGAVDVRLGHSVDEVSHADNRFSIRIAGGTCQSRALVLATGGPSIPKMGATGFSYDLAKKFGLNIVTPRPALVPLTLGGGDAHFTELAGVSAPVVAHCGKTSFREAFLFTHRGLSGPAILQVSSYWRPGQEVRLNLLPDQPENWLRDNKRKQPKATLRAQLAKVLPSRLAERIAAKLEMAGAARWPVRPSPRGCRRPNRQLAASAHRNRRLCQSRSHGWWHRYRGTVIALDAGETSFRSLCYWRVCRCHRLAWRIQLSVGLGQRVGRRQRHLNDACASSQPEPVGTERGSNRYVWALSRDQPDAD